MARKLSVRTEQWTLSKPFRIARGVRTVSEVVVVDLQEDDVLGRGEGAPIARYIDTAQDCREQIEALRGAIEGGMDRQTLLGALKPGAARNALDCAMWDLEVRLAGTNVSAMLSSPNHDQITTAMTVSLDSPTAMAQAASGMSHLPLLKIKVNADDPAAQILAVREAAPQPILIVDVNEGWTMSLLRSMQPTLERADVAMLEQPLPAGEDEALRGFLPQVPICADESCHTAADLDRLSGLYQAVNIKLDKTGGLTAALELLQAARSRQLAVMTGCMICTSLSIAPALQVAVRSDFADLDGPTWLAKDREGGVKVQNGLLSPPTVALWGGN